MNFYIILLEDPNYSNKNNYKSSITSKKSVILVSVQSSTKQTVLGSFKTVETLTSYTFV